MTKKAGGDFKSSLKQLESILALYFGEKAPALPKDWKELIVKIAPWLALIVALLSLPAILAILGIGALFMPFSYLGGMRYGVGFTFNWVLIVITALVTVLAIPGLFKRSRQGWALLFYASLISIVEGVLAMRLGGVIIGTLINWYILFQVREYYK